MPRPMTALWRRLPTYAGQPPAPGVYYSHVFERVEAWIRVGSQGLAVAKTHQIPIPEHKLEEWIKKYGKGEHGG